MAKIVGRDLSEHLFRFGSFWGLFRSALFPIEAALVGAMISRLPPKLRRTIKAQFDCYNRFQRDGEMRQLSMYRKISGRISFPEDLALASSKGNVRLASLRFKVAEGFENSAVFHVVKGHLYTMECGQSYFPLRMHSQVEIAKVTINNSDFREEDLP